MPDRRWIGVALLVAIAVAGILLLGRKQPQVDVDACIRRYQRALTAADSAAIDASTPFATQRGRSTARALTCGELRSLGML